ncbi:putative NADPH:adrenodoxin oxidoreductase, mitochondrial [Colletotrichum chlorophyti]|uniref:NADPH:adrenodoxin oxidoreductase, mitochondrial n=1 Tax=Colletotrichum chlorophyti TaxID=708187 RepID=A0A1Q8S2K6_9PEZI|nr:putative NADPH:adrenodoxin oxidoreductase, mitochondrial [Colletotrichum chlorophyti]
MLLSRTRPWLYPTCSHIRPRLGSSNSGIRFMSTESPFTRRVRQPDSPFRLAVVGSGPAGFYAAYRVMSRLPEAKIDMYESLPVPFGLVRFGVAPDHPEVKNCQDKFEEVASSPNFSFIGNVSIGDSGLHPDSCLAPFPTLLRHYDAVLLAYGAAKDRTLGIPGESNLRGIYSARQFVGWYNGLPEYAGLAPDLTKGEEAVIIGQGNVALDVARMLLEDVNVLRRTDITEQALEQLATSRVKRVHVVGRRGPMQAAFTIKEVRELMKISNIYFHPADSNLIPADLKSLPRAPRRLMEVVAKGSAARPEDVKKSWSLDFCLNPVEFLPRKTAPSDIGSTTFERTELSSKFDPGAQVRLTGETTTLPSDLVFRSIGYKSVALPGFKEAGVAFDERRGVVMNDGRGRVFSLDQDAASDSTELGVRPGVYCAGWVKRGPTGVIASTMQDAFETGDSIVQDWLSGLQFLPQSGAQPTAGWEGVSSEIGESASKRVSWADWHRIDRAERKKGKAAGKEREKFTSTKAMLEVLS